MNPLAIIKPYLWGGAILIVLTLLLSIFWLRDSLQDSEADTKKAKTEAATEKAAKIQAIQTISSIQKNAAADHKLLEGYQSVKTEIQYIDREVVKQVIKYRENAVNRCTLSSDWVRIHNDSADSVRGENSPGGTNDAPAELAKTTH